MKPTRYVGHTRLTCVVFMTLVSVSTVDATSVVVPVLLENEMIVTRDTDDGSVLNVRWCGSTVLAYDVGYPHHDGKEKLPATHAVYWVDVRNSQAVEVPNSSGANLVDCSSDGDWIVYWGSDGMWRHNRRTNARSRFSPRPSDAGSSIESSSVDYAWPMRRIERNGQSPEWQSPHLARNYSPNGLELVWFHDMQRLLVKFQSTEEGVQSGFQFGVEVHNSDSGGSSTFRALNSDLNLSVLRIDNQDRIFGVIDPARPWQLKKGTLSRKLARCEVVENKLRCVELFPNERYVFPYGVSMDGQTIVYQKDNEPCIWLSRANRKEQSCVAKTYSPGRFEISPDSRVLAYIRPAQTDSLTGQLRGSVLALLKLPLD